MISYYFALALRSLQRNVVLTALTVAAVAVGVGSSMSTYAMFRALSSDPIPGKSAQLFVPQIDNLGPTRREKSGEMNRHLNQLTYRDAMALMQAHQATRQSVSYHIGFTLFPNGAGQRPFHASGRAVSADFFEMFDAPFRAGSGWNKDDEDAHANVVVLNGKLAERLFPGENAVGHTVRLEDTDYRVVGVLDSWQLPVRIYDLANDPLKDTEEVFLPFATAVEHQMQQDMYVRCVGKADPGFQGMLNAECFWVAFWAELPTAADADRYRTFVDHYAAEQQRIGRFSWPPLTRLRNAREWLEYMHIVPDEVRVTVLLSFGFLAVCLINAIGLMLAKLSGKARELGVRRALGATTVDLFLQCLVESAVIGLVGGIAGLGVIALGLSGERAISPDDMVRFEHLDGTIVVMTLAVAVLSTVIAGLYPAWRASRVLPALQMKTQ